MVDDLPYLLDRIRALVDDPVDDSPERLLERMEHTLTDGYAHALALEGRSIRLEREIGATVVGVKDGRGADDLEPLVDCLTANERELGRLRELLDTLKHRVDGARSDAAAAATAS